MMNDKETNQFINEIIPILQGMKEHLEREILYPGKRGSCIVNVWANDEGIVVGSISYYPENDPNEESTDLVFDFHYAHQVLKGSVDVVYSNGQVISEVVQQETTYLKQEDLLRMISSIIKENQYQAQESFLRAIRRR